MEKLITTDENVYQGNSLFNLLLDFLKQNKYSNKEEISKVFKKEIDFNFIVDDYILYYFIRRLISLVLMEFSNAKLRNQMFASEDIIRKHLSENFNFSIDQLNGISNILYRLVSEIKLNDINKGDYNKNLVEYAKNKNVQCYICGCAINYDNKEQKNSCTLDHYIPRSLGGNKSLNNIFIACKRCNKAKKNYSSWVETNFNIINVNAFDMTNDNDISMFKKKKADIISSEQNLNEFIDERMKEKIGPELIYIVSSMNKYKCSYCDSENDQCQDVYIIRKEENDSIHPHNLEIVCGECLDELDSYIMSTSDYISRVRISEC